MSEVSQPTVERVLGRLRDGRLVEPGQRCVALVSGGRDSVCLLDALVTICGSAAVEVLHVNYGLRGDDADADERHVRGLCDSYGVGAVVLRAGEPPRTGNLQAWARDLRYGEAARLALASGARIATGHTASDQVETILYRLAASPGRRALLGMSRRDGRLIRPLLGSTREETADYCRERDLAWREDATNADERFARGRIRHGLLGELRRVHPAAEQNILASAEQLRAEAAALDAVVAGVLEGRNTISIAELIELDPAIAKLILVRLAEDAAGKAVPTAAARLSELAALATKGGSTEIHLAGVTAVIEYGVLHFTTQAARPQPGEVALTTPGQATFGVWRLTASLHTDLAGTDALEHLNPDGSVGVLDADTLELDKLTVRGWHTGDRLRPVGLDGSKTLADLFTDRKLPRAERAGTPLLASAGEIVWIPGIATAQRVAVGPETTRVVVLSATRA